MLIQKRSKNMPRPNGRKKGEKNHNPKTASLELLVLYVSIECETIFYYFNINVILNINR